MSSSGVQEASIKVADRSGNVEHTAADGNGPVNALDNALRKALCRFYPSLADIRLTDYKVRVLDEASATAASVRVLIRTAGGKRSWTTVGVSDNVVSASLDALVDSFEYYLMKTEEFK
jgi:2-isopropylmalate synthase